MSIGWIKTGLQQIPKFFRRVLDDSVDYVIPEAIAELESSKRLFDNYSRRTDNPQIVPNHWGYRIRPEQPLRFRPSRAIKGLPLWVDVYCTVRWRDEKSPPVEQVIHLRVWSNEERYIYREDWDSQSILEQLTDGDTGDMKRVLLRCHFDLANSGQHGPRYHLQFGGEAREDELCWFPGILNLPRFAYPPMDLILICQMITANFYWEEYEKLRESPEWLGVLRNSQKYLLRGYYQECLEALDRENSLLDHLWNR